MSYKSREHGATLNTKLPKIAKKLGGDMRAPLPKEPVHHPTKGQFIVQHHVRRRQTRSS